MSKPVTPFKCVSSINGSNLDEKRSQQELMNDEFKKVIESGNNFCAKFFKQDTSDHTGLAQLQMIKNLLLASIFLQRDLHNIQLEVEKKETSQILNQLYKNFQLIYDVSSQLKQINNCKTDDVGLNFDDQADPENLFKFCNDDTINWRTVKGLAEFKKMIRKDTIRNIILELQEDDFKYNKAEVTTTQDLNISGLVIKNTCQDGRLLTFKIKYPIRCQNVDLHHINVRFVDDCNSRRSSIHLNNITSRYTQFINNASVYIYRFSKVWCNNIRINESAHYGLGIYSCKNVEVSGIQSNYCKEDGICFCGCPKVTARDVTSIDCETGIRFYNSQGQILNSGIEDCDVGICLSASKVYRNQLHLKDNQKEYELSLDSQWLHTY